MGWRRHTFPAHEQRTLWRRAEGNGAEGGGAAAARRRAWERLAELCIDGLPAEMKTMREYPWLVMRIVAVVLCRSRAEVSGLSQPPPPPPCTEGS